MSKRISTSFNEHQIALLEAIVTKMTMGSDLSLLAKNKHFGSLVGAIQSLKRRVDNPTAPKPLTLAPPAEAADVTTNGHSTHAAEDAAQPESA